MFSHKKCFFNLDKVACSISQSSGSFQHDMVASSVKFVLQPLPEGIIHVHLQCGWEFVLYSHQLLCADGTVWGEEDRVHVDTGSL